MLVACNFVHLQPWVVRSIFLEKGRGLVVRRLVQPNEICLGGECCDGGNLPETQSSTVGLGKSRQPSWAQPDILEELKMVMQIQCSAMLVVGLIRANIRLRLGAI